MISSILRNSSKVNIKNIKYYVLALWLFVMMVIPAVPSLMKLMPLILLVILQLCSNGISYYQSMAKACLIWIAFFGLTFVISAFNGFPFEPVLFEIYILRPIIFILIIPIINNKKALYFLTQVLIYMALLVSIYNGILFLQTLKLLPVMIDEELLYDEVHTLVIVGDNFFTYRSTNQTSLMFLTPLVLIINSKKKSFSEYFQKIIFITAFLCTVISLSCGRRILQLETAIVLLLLFFYNMRKLNSRIKLRILIIAIITLVCIFIFIIKNIELMKAIGQTLFSIFDAMKTTQARTNQFPALIELWQQSPLLGNGISASTSKSYGSNSYSYEYFYIALLAQIGIIGVSLVAFYVIKIIATLSNYCKKSFDDFEVTVIAAIITGFIGFLFCGATNPMVTSSWMWFIIISTFYYCYRNRAL